MKINKDTLKEQTNNENNAINSSQKADLLKLPSEAQERELLLSVDENFNLLNSILRSDFGLITMKYEILQGNVSIGIAYVESIADIKLISSQIIAPLLGENSNCEDEYADIMTLLQSKLIYVPNIKKSGYMKQVVEGLLNGNTVLFINGINIALIISASKGEKRAIEKPDNEVAVLGSTDSFTEDLNTNCGMIIKRLPTPDLHFEAFTVGRLSQTKVKLLWIEGIANMKAVTEARLRIQNIDVDIVDGIGVLSELIDDNPISVFPKYKQTQRPDLTAKVLSDGHFVLLCSNSPFALIAPVSFFDNFKTMDDYAERTLVTSYLRFVRYVSFLLSTAISPFYLAFVTYNHSIVPPPLALNIAAGREGVPFPSFLELLIMTFAITVIREASLRIQRAVGFFVGTLSAIIIGQSAVIAGYVSASVIIVVAISAISSFAISTTTMVYPSRLINYFLIILSGSFGMFGLINGMVIVIWHLVSLESFGMPYLYPLVPFDLNAMKDTFIRAPFSTLKKRFKLLAQNNQTRMSNRGIKRKNWEGE